MTDPAGYCRSCDYDLRGLPEKHRCPECGRAYDLADPSSVRKRPRRGIWRKLRWVVYPLLLVVLAASAGIGWTYWEWRSEQPVIAWVYAHSGLWDNVVHTKPIGPDWLQKRVGRWAWLLERANELWARSDKPVKAADVPLSRFHHLRTLYLNGLGINDDLMGEVGRLQELTYIALGETAVTDDGLARLATCRNLENLVLYGSRVGDKGLAPLAGHPELTSLNLWGTPVDDRAIPVLKMLTKLTYLDLRETKITPEGLAELKVALPACQIADP